MRSLINSYYFSLLNSLAEGNDESKVISGELDL